MSPMPLYVVCVSNVYAEAPDQPKENAEQRASRTERHHYVGFSANEADTLVQSRFSRCGDHNWTVPVLLGEYLTKLDAGGRLVADVDSLICPHCGASI